MKLGRDVSRHNELDNWRNTHRYESVMADYMALFDDIRNRPWFMGQALRYFIRYKV